MKGKPKLLSYLSALVTFRGALAVSYCPPGLTEGREGEVGCRLPRLGARAEHVFPAVMYRRTTRYNHVVCFCWRLMEGHPICHMTPDMSHGSSVCQYTFLQILKVHYLCFYGPNVAVPLRRYCMWSRLPKASR